MRVKPLILSALMMLPVLGAAQAQGRWPERRQEIHQDLRQDRRDFHQAVRNGDWNTARHEAHQIRRDERRLDRSNNHYYLQRSNYHYPGSFYRYNRFRTYP